MQGFEIRLRGDGTFEPAEGLPDTRVGRGTEAASGWKILRRDWTGVRWMPDDECHDSLDGALECLALEAGASDWRVVLPDGVSFRRPGGIPIEQVMAAAGWIYVDAFIGYAMIRLPDSADFLPARRAVRAVLAGLDVHVGDVDPCDRDVNGSYWCADICLEVGGFMRTDEIERSARSAFELEGVKDALNAKEIELVDAFDYRTSTPTVPSGAVIIPFPSERVRRSAA